MREGSQVESQTGEYGKEMRPFQKWLLERRYSFVGGYEPVRKISGFQFAATNPHITSRATSIFYLKLEFSKTEANSLHHNPFISAYTTKKKKYVTLHVYLTLTKFSRHSYSLTSYYVTALWATKIIIPESRTKTMREINMTALHRILSDNAVLF